MKIGDRVRLSINQRSSITRALRGTIVDLGNLFVTVKWDTGPMRAHAPMDIIEAEAEPFPFRSHRTMAEVIEDEQKPVPA